MKFCVSYIIFIHQYVNYNLALHVQNVIPQLCVYEDVVVGSVFFSLTEILLVCLTADDFACYRDSLVDIPSVIISKLGIHEVMINKSFFFPKITHVMLWNPIETWSTPQNCSIFSTIVHVLKGQIEVCCVKVIPSYSLVILSFFVGSSCILRKLFACSSVCHFHKGKLICSIDKINFNFLSHTQDEKNFQRNLFTIRK